MLLDLIERIGFKCQFSEDVEKKLKYAKGRDPYEEI
jgi:hypothetical protein